MAVERPVLGRAKLELAGLVGLVATILLAGCARDPVQVGWDDAWHEAEQAHLQGRHEDALEHYNALALDSPRAIDESAVRFGQARSLLALNRPLEAVSYFWAIAQQAPRRPDRARALYEIARYCESQGMLQRAVSIYRGLVRVYPELMPGERALAHLQRIFEARGARGVEAHLGWTYELYDVIAHTSLADNFLYYAGSLAQRRYRERREPHDARLAEAILKRLIADHPLGGLWNDAWWDLSLLYRQQGRAADEVEAIRRVQGTRETISLFGHDDHTYFWVGQLRIARLYLEGMDSPREAAEAYAVFIDAYPDSIWLDDVHFWQGCAWLRAGEPALAEASFEGIAAAYADSKYLARVPLARADPDGPVCQPKDLVEDPR